MNYETDVSIDESALDVEWLDQASLTMKYCQLEAEAQRAYDNAKERLDIVRAELYQKITNDPDSYNLPKTTEGAINGAILMTEKYQEAQEDVGQALYEYQMAKAAVRAMYAKKDALENLVRLHGQQYFAGPSVPRDLSKEWEQRARQVDSNKKVKISRKRKHKK